MDIQKAQVELEIARNDYCDIAIGRETEMDCDWEEDEGEQFHEYQRLRAKFKNVEDPLARATVIRLFWRQER